MTPSLDDRILGVLYGAACADALGGPVEGLDHRELSERHGRVATMLPYPKPPAEHAQFTNEPGSVTDDTRLHRIHCDALIASGGRALAGDLALAIDRWRDARHAQRLREVVRELPELPQILCELGYERDDAWFADLSSARPAKAA